MASIIIAVAGISYRLLDSRIATVHTSLDKRIDDLGDSLTKRIDDLNDSLTRRIDDLFGLALEKTVAPFPAPAKVPVEKVVEIPKSELLTAERGEKIVAVEAGDYVVLPLQFSLGETVTIEWQTVGLAGKNLVDFYLLDEEGNVYRFNARAAEYETRWMSPKGTPFYLYFSNTFDPTTPKEFWVRLVGSE